MTVDEYLKSSGLQGTASVTFNDLKEVLEGAAPASDANAGAPATPAPAASPAPTAPATPAPAPAAAAPAVPVDTIGGRAPGSGANAGAHDAKLLERLRAEYPDVAATLEREVTRDESPAPVA